MVKATAKMGRGKQKPPPQNKKKEAETMNAANALEKYKSNCVEMGDCCQDKECRYWHDWMETGNCVLRVKREHSLDEIGVAEGGITKERVRQIEEKALKKFERNMKMGVMLSFLEPNREVWEYGKRRRKEEKEK
jgi:hypothetical protein